MSPVVNTTNSYDTNNGTHQLRFLSNFLTSHKCHRLSYVFDYHK